MRRYLFAIIFIFGVVYGSSFPSLSENNFLSEIVNNQDFKTGKRKIGFLHDYLLKHHAKKGPDGRIYHPDGWLQFKYYAPPGTSTHLVLATLPNTSMRIDLKFKGDKNNIINHIDPKLYTIVFDPKKNPLYSQKQPTIKNLAVNTFNSLTYDLNEGGWIYVSIVENSIEYSGDNGYVPQAIVRVFCSIKVVNKEKFNKWLSTVKLTHPGGDPIDDIDELIEYDNILKNGKIVSIQRYIPLNTFGTYQVSSSSYIQQNQNSKSSYINSSSSSSEIPPPPPETHYSSSSSSSSSTFSSVAQQEYYQVSSSSVAHECPAGYVYDPDPEIGCRPAAAGETQQSASSSSSPIFSSVAQQEYYQVSSSSVAHECPAGYVYDPDPEIGCRPAAAGETQQSASSSSSPIFSSVAQQIDIIPGDSAMVSQAKSSQDNQIYESSNRCGTGERYDEFLGECVISE